MARRRFRGKPVGGSRMIFRRSAFENAGQSSWQDRGWWSSGTRGVDETESRYCVSAHLGFRASGSTGNPPSAHRYRTASALSRSGAPYGIPARRRMKQFAKKDVRGLQSSRSAPRDKRQQPSRNASVIFWLTMPYGPSGRYRNPCEARAAVRVKEVDINTPRQMMSFDRGSSERNGPTVVSNGRQRAAIRNSLSDVHRAGGDRRLRRRARRHDETADE